MGSDITDSDPEVIESLKYLVISSDERARLQSLPFDGKKQCWIPDAKEGFISAEIISTKGADVTLKTSKGEVWVLWDFKISFNWLFSQECYLQKRWC